MCTYFMSYNPRSFLRETGVIDNAHNEGVGMHVDVYNIYVYIHIDVVVVLNSVVFGA